MLNDKRNNYICVLAYVHMYRESFRFEYSAITNYEFVSECWIDLIAVRSVSNFRRSCNKRLLHYSVNNQYLKSVIDSIFRIKMRAERFEGIYSERSTVYIGHRFDRQPEENNSMAPPATLTRSGRSFAG